MKKLLFVLIVIAIILGLVLFINGDKDNIILSTKGDNAMDKKINIIINEINYEATLDNNSTTREFVKRLPLEIKMDELNGNEKYYYFPDSLPSNPSRVGKINNGDLMLYGNDCLVLFYESFDTPYSYTRIGKIDNPSSLKKNVGKGSIRIVVSK